MHDRAVQEVIAHLQKRLERGGISDLFEWQIQEAIRSLREGGDPSLAKTVIQEEMDRLQMREEYSDEAYELVKELRALESFLDELFQDYRKARRTPNKELVTA